MKTVYEYGAGLLLDGSAFGKYGKAVARLYRPKVALAIGRTNFSFLHRNIIFLLLIFKLYRYHVTSRIIKHIKLFISDLINYKHISYMCLLLSNLYITGFNCFKLLIMRIPSVRPLLSCPRWQTAYH